MELVVTLDAIKSLASEHGAEKVHPVLDGWRFTRGPVSGTLAQVGHASLFPVSQPEA